MTRPGSRVPAVALMMCLAYPLASAMAQSCAGTGSVLIAVENLSTDATITVAVTGELVDASATCSGAGSTTYAALLVCTGGSMARCGRITGLRPGQWKHRIALQVTGSELQSQAQRTVILGGAAGDVSNVVQWRGYSRTFVVEAATETAVRAALTNAAAFTAGDPSRTALVRFAASAFPGAHDPKTIFVRHTPPIFCTDETCSDGRPTGLCIEGSRMVVDALDADAEAGGVVLSSGSCNRSTLRVLGNDNVFRGLSFVGGQKVGAAIDVDTVAISGADDPDGDFGQGNRFEQCVFQGPTKGDAISVERGASGVVIADSEIWGAEDKGLKALSDGEVTLERSCVHDNRNGGVQSTLGGIITARENVIQHNLPGEAQNGLFVLSTSTVRSMLTTDGNIVRFNGSRGITVVNNGEGHFHNDYVADNAFAGARVETTPVSLTPTLLPVPEAVFRGVAFVCNGVAGLSGDCHTGAVFVEPRVKCQFDPNPLLAQCPGEQMCVQPPPVPAGTGFVAAACDTGCSDPLVDLGTGGDPGRNAFTLNPQTLEGANLNNALSSPLMARGNQWEHCGTGNTCDPVLVLANDVRPPSTPMNPVADVGTPTAHFKGIPTVDRVTARRPRKGDLVHVYGFNFNAIDLATCAGTSLPEASCSAANPALADANRNSAQRGNRVELTIGGVVVDPADVPIHALTPTMIAFEMPIDCHGAGTLRVGKGNDPADVSAAIPFCDPLGCMDEPVSTPCDDGDGCTFDDHCSGEGACVPGTTVTCTGQCLTGGCDPAQGCIPKPVETGCDDGDACTVGDHCSGTDAGCGGGSTVVCAGVCLSGACDPDTGCVPSAATATCDDGDPCTLGEHCSGVDGRCGGGVANACDDDNACTDDYCDGKVGCVYVQHAPGSQCAPAEGCFPPSTCQGGQCELVSPPRCDDGDACTTDSCQGIAGCQYAAIDGLPGVRCRVDQVRGLLDGLPSTLEAFARKVRRRLVRVDTQLVGAEEAAGDGNTRRMTRKLGQAARGLARVDRALGRAAALPLPLGRQLRDAARTAVDQLEALRQAALG